MDVEELALPGVLRLTPKVFGDDRGFFVETFSVPRYADVGIPGPFVQDNLSRSGRGILRGLHLQHPHAQGKLVSVVEGEVFDVAVDVRVGSPTFGQWAGSLLSQVDKRQLWVPPGFAHGFLVTSEHATFAYKCTELYAPEHELSVRWDDPALGIEWPLADMNAPKLSEKDRNAPCLADIPADRLPQWSAT